MISKKENYINLATLKRDGTYINTPVWFAQEGESNNYYVYTLKKSGKVKRIRNFSDIKIAVCNFSGKLKGDWINASADLIEDTSLINHAYYLLRGKYGILFRISDFFSLIVGNYYRRQIIKISIKS